MVAHKINSIGRIKDALVLLLLVIVQMTSASFLNSLYCKFLGKLLCELLGKCKKCDDETDAPSAIPSSSMPSSAMPSAIPTSGRPTMTPTMMPSASPTSGRPTMMPSAIPTSGTPTMMPSAIPTSAEPTNSPTTYCEACGFQASSIVNGQPVSPACGTGTYAGCTYLLGCVADCVNISSSDYVSSNVTFSFYNLTQSEAFAAFCSVCPPQSTAESFETCFNGGGGFAEFILPSNTSECLSYVDEL